MKTKLVFSRTLTIVVLVMFTQFSSAVPGLNPNDFNEERLLELDACLQSIDKKIINSLIIEERKMKKEVLESCGDDYDQAEALAIEYKEELNSRDDIQTIKDCGEGSELLLQQFSLSIYSEESKEHDNPEHICNVKNDY